MAGDRAEQLVLGLGHRAALGREDFVIAPENATALAMIEGWRTWPGGRLALVGPARSGKSHLAAVWQAGAGAQMAAAADLREDAVEELVRGPVAVEDVPRIAALAPVRRAEAERALFHLLNLAAAEGRPVLVTGREPPARWPIAMPDLASRLSAMPVASLEPPGDRLLSALLVKLFADRQVEVGSRVVSYILTRIDRSADAVEAFAAELDRRSLAEKRPITVAMAAALIDEKGP